jgi:hypothetical protein
LPSQGVAEYLRQKLAEPDLRGSSIVSFWVGDEEYEAVAAAVLQVAGGGRARLRSRNAPGQQIRVSATFQLLPEHRRAVAKTAFHYVLKHRPRLTGCEAAFEPIKRFIMAGKPVDESTFRAAPPFLDQLPLGQGVITHWTHFLAARFIGGAVVVRAQFFVSRELAPPAWEVRLADGLSSVQQEGGALAHRFSIYSTRREGYDGEMAALPDALALGVFAPPDE